MISSRMAVALVATIGVACTGSVDRGATHEDGSGGEGENGSGGERGSAGASGPIDPHAIGSWPLRRLTTEEYNHTVRDLIGDASSPAQPLGADPRGGSGFRTPGLVALPDARSLLQVAETIAATAVKSPKFTTCTAGAAEDSCAKAFFTSFGRRAYRRPLEAEEVAQLVALYNKARTTLSYPFQDAVRVVVTAMLQSPSFLYHWEQGSKKPQVVDGSIAATPHAIAARLSYLLWSTMPDETLFAAADAGKLSTPAELAAQARRMLADAKAKDAVESFHMQWLSMNDVATTEKDPTTFPTFTTDLAAAMDQETRAFVDWAVLTGDGRMDTLLTSTKSFVNAPLASFYGVSSFKGNAVAETPLPSERTGLLTRGAFLASHAKAYETNPVKRGKDILDRVLCGSVPPPPNDVPQLKPPTPNLSTRERFAEHSQNPACAGCHKLMDPIGFALEAFDGAGAHRDTDGGKPIDTKGTITFPNGDTNAFNNATQMIAAISASEDARHCLSTQWLRFSLGRAEEPQDQGTMKSVHDAFRASDYNVRELLVAFVQSRSFSYRRPTAGEVSP